MHKKLLESHQDVGGSRSVIAELANRFCAVHRLLHINKAASWELRGARALAWQGHQGSLEPAQSGRWMDGSPCAPARDHKAHLYRDQLFNQNNTRSNTTTGPPPPLLLCHNAVLFVPQALVGLQAIGETHAQWVVGRVVGIGPTHSGVRERDAAKPPHPQHTDYGSTPGQCTPRRQCPW